MAHIEPMDIDDLECDYEDKENSKLHSNVLSRTPCTEKGYEELDVSELNMKLRYSITPASSPMSRSFTANCKESKNIEDKNNMGAFSNVCLTSSFNSTLTNNDSYKITPLHSLPTDQSNDINRNVLGHRSLDTDVDNNITITVSDNIDDNYSIPSTSSSIPHTPEATTPTKELPKDGGSPIMRGLRSVLSMFRPSQSPIPSHEQISPSSIGEPNISNTDNSQLHPIEVSTPLHKTNRNSPKRNSPLKDSLIFKDDLEKELQWKDESTIIFKEEKIPKHKLLLQESVASNLESKLLNKTMDEYNKTLEYMDISCNDSLVHAKTMIDVEINKTNNIEAGALESDSEFVDCETTYSKVEIESCNRTKENELKGKEKTESDLKTDTIQNSTYNGNNYSLNETVPLESFNPSNHIDEELKGFTDITMIKAETFHANNDRSPNSDLDQLKNSMSEIASPALSEINVCDSKMAAQSVIYKNATFNNDNNSGTIIIDSEVMEDKDTIINNTLTSFQNITENKNGKIISDCHKHISNLILPNEGESLVGVINIVSEDKILNHSSIDKIESDVIKIEEKDTLTIVDNSVANYKEIHSTNINKEVFCNLEQAVDTNKTIITEDNMHTIEEMFSKGDGNLFLKDDNNMIQDINVETNQTNLLTTNLNMTHNISLENNEDTKDSILYNENRYFGTSIESEIPIEEILKCSGRENKSNETFQINIDCGKFCQSSDVSITKEHQDTLENTEPVLSCPEENNVHLSDNLNDSRIICHNRTSSDKVNSESIQDVELPIDIPLPSDNELEQDMFEKNDIIFLNNSEIQLKTEPEYHIDNQNTITKPCENISDTIKTKSIEETDSVVGEICEINNQESISTIENFVNPIKENLTTSNENEMGNNTFEVINETILNKDDMLENTEANKSGIINSVNSNLKDDISLDKYNEQMQINSELNVFHTNNEIMFLENSSTSNLTSNIKIDSITVTIAEELNSLETINKLQISPPLSPLMNKKGYDISFDDIENPFATKTKIRLSPTPENPTKISALPIQDSNFEKKNNTNKKNTPKNRRKSQPIRKSVNAKKNSLNATLDCDIKTNFTRSDVENNDLNAVLVAREENIETSEPIADNLANTEFYTFNKSKIVEENVLDRKEIYNSAEILCENSEGYKKTNLFSDSTEPAPLRDVSKSVFNCPEINDVKFRSISDQQRMASSNSDLITDDQKIINNSSTTLKVGVVESFSPEVKQEKESATNISNETCLTRNTESDTTGEVNTEDEDTATFIKTEELIEHSNLEKFCQEKNITEFEVPHSVEDNDNIDNGELFIDAEAFEFLLNQNRSNIIADSGKESLFLKFDPLFAKRVSSDGVMAALKKVQNKQSTPKKLIKLQMDEASNMPGPSKLETTFDDTSEDGSIQAMSKPMMVVNPAVSSIVSPRKAITPKVNRQSLTFTSPAMAVIDKLLSLSGNNSTGDQNTSATSPIRQLNDTDVAITQLREMLADKDIHVHNLRSESKELKDRLSNMEAQVKILESESAERLKKVNDLSDRLVEKTKMNKSMATVVEEYERTIASLITQMEQEKKNNSEEKMRLIKERDEQTAHLASMEVSFSDLHSKYEKSKQIIYSMKSKEDTYRKSIKEFEESLVKMQNNYELLKQHATSKLNHANQELEKFNRGHEAEILKLNALIKRKELHITSLEETLAQKTKANVELTAICDELINKVG